MLRKRMRLISLNMPEPYLRGLSVLVKDKLYPNRAEAIRMAVRNLLTDFGMFSYTSLVTERGSAVSEPTTKKEVENVEEKEEEEEQEEEEEKEED